MAHCLHRLMKNWYITTYLVVPPPPNRNSPKLRYLIHDHPEEYKHGKGRAICEMSRHGYWRCPQCTAIAPDEMAFVAEISGCVRYPFGKGSGE